MFFCGSRKVKMRIIHSIFESRFPPLCAPCYYKRIRTHIDISVWHDVYGYHSSAGKGDWKEAWELQQTACMNMDCSNASLPTSKYILLLLVLLHTLCGLRETQHNTGITYFSYRAPWRFHITKSRDSWWKRCLERSLGVVADSLHNYGCSNASLATSK